MEEALKIRYYGRTRYFFPRCSSRGDNSTCYVHDLWLLLVTTQNGRIFFSFDLKNWITWNLSKNIGKNSSQFWSSIFGTALWKIWLWRNDVVFKEADPETGMELFWQIQAALQRFSMCILWKERFHLTRLRFQSDGAFIIMIRLSFMLMEIAIMRVSISRVCVGA